ncbi:choline kinase family protein [Hoeflea prorocentri]|uniref:Choline kinase family protein n=1 Tax=Hoeflea prorocentri TaxID=1922333 RepID=A0A9X3UEY5_9HYPH|nr:choline kinase family protein [Hoeflea prorocentri]MCY6379613.1 choline kinase family protein [Hoeflea prorocentri]MDA5397413.1 choline kinase family protein [Hoeflea prorocentri]
MSRRHLGKATNEAESKVEAAIRAVQGWTLDGLSYEPVPGGISNANWRIFLADQERTYFLKVPGEGTEHFIQRTAANEASTRAFEVGVGAEVIHFDPQSGVEVFEFIDGLRTSTNGDFLDRTVRCNAVKALRAFNNARGLALQKTTMDMIEEHFDQALEFGGYFPQDFTWINAKYRQAKDALIASGLDLVPCMNDTLAGNFLLDAENNVTLVDFEYASNNDRCAELALWFVEMCFDPDIENEVIEEYFGSVDPRISTRITIFKALVDLKWATWAMVQNRLSALDFDYFKYGVWKHMRARHVMRDPRWDDWLKAV